jgi:hypothetical protein
MKALRVSATALILAIPLSILAQNSDDAGRLRRVEEEVAKRRRLLEAAIGERGIVFAPYKYDDAWYATARDLVVADAALATCGQLFANYARKEVMVSGRVIQRKITLRAAKVRGVEGLALLRSALEAKGIAILPVGSRSLALIDAAEAAR